MRKLSVLSLLFISLVTMALGQSGASSERNFEGEPLLENYVIQPLDIFRISVFKEPDLLTEVRVSKDGSVVLPLIGKISVGGMSVINAQQMITDLYNRNYLVDPQLTLMMIRYTEHRIHVHGQVRLPGPVIIPPEETMTLSQAISAAGGLTRLGDGGDVRLKRVGANGISKVIRINFNKILKNPQAKDIEVIDGDNIFVSERIF